MKRDKYLKQSKEKRYYIHCLKSKNDDILLLRNYASQTMEKLL